MIAAAFTEFRKRIASFLDKVESLCSSSDTVAVSILLPIEILATCSRLKRENKVTGIQYKKIKEELFLDLGDITTISPTPSIVNIP